MKLSALLEAVDYYKFNKLKPVNEAYNGEMFTRYHKQFQTLSAIDTELPFIDTEGENWTTLHYFLEAASFPRESSYRFGDFVESVLLPRISEKIKDNTNRQFACNEIWDLLEPEKVQAAYKEYKMKRGYNENAPSAKAIADFEKNSNRYLVNIHSIVNKLLPNQVMFKLSDVPADKVHELDFAETRLKIHNRDLMFWENSNGELVAISIGPKLVFIMQANHRENLVYKIIDFINPGNKLDEVINPESWAKIFETYKESGMSYGVEYEIIKRMKFLFMRDIDIYYNCRRFRNPSEFMFYGEKEIKKKIGTTTTKIFTDPAYNPMDYELDKPVKCFAIPADVFAKYSDADADKARREYRNEYINKYKTIDEREQDRKKMQERYNSLKKICANTREFTETLAKLENLFEVISDKQKAINEFTIRIITNPGLPEAKLLNVPGPSNYYTEPGTTDWKGKEKSYISYLQTVTYDMNAVQHQVLDAMEIISELSLKTIAVQARNNPQVILEIENKINTKVDNIRSAIRDIKKHLTYREWNKKIVERLAEINPEYSGLFDISTIQI